MIFRTGQLLFLAILLLIMPGCRTPDPALRFIAQTDRAPVDERPKDWEQTKKLMARTVPTVGQSAPDFTLPTLDGAQTVTRSVYQAHRPLVLIFGSFT